MINKKTLSISLLISLGVGAISGILTSNSMEQYNSYNQPSLAPPGFIFPIVWTILYTLMGISSYIVYESDSEYRIPALMVYAIQLIFNFIWPILFFNLNMFLLAFIWLILLWALILAMTLLFYRVDKKAGILQIPYLLWVTFAGYLNFMVYYLNQ